jgi:hypothetical protein
MAAKINDFPSIMIGLFEVGKFAHKLILTIVEDR